MEMKNIYIALLDFLGSNSKKKKKLFQASPHKAEKELMMGFQASHLPLPRRFHQ